MTTMLFVQSIFNIIVALAGQTRLAVLVVAASTSCALRPVVAKPSDCRMASSAEKIRRHFADLHGRDVGE